MPILRTLCYNDSLVAWTVVSLTTAKFILLLYVVLIGKNSIENNASSSSYIFGCVSVAKETCLSEIT
jgi:hypothetical protein